MDTNISCIISDKLSKLPSNTKEAVDCFISILTEYLHPIYIKLEKELEKVENGEMLNDKLENNKMLCFNLLSKYIKLMKEIFKLEAQYSCILQESRNWVVGRIDWVLKLVDELKSSDQVDVISAFINYDGDEFVLSIDKALDVLDNIKKYFEDDFEKDNLNINNLWKVQCTRDLMNLHMYVKDTVSGGMKICQNCLSTDQNVIIARCHVAFRELKKFLIELTLKGDNINIDDFVINAEDIKQKDNLHYPTVRLLSDILKDAIYNLEATINRAVLTIVLCCMADPIQPLNGILEMSKQKTIPTDSTYENLLENFDIHLERVVQVGLFSISCSSDKKRIFMLRNCLVSIEDLEVQLIPSLKSNAQSVHSSILIKQWKKEMNALKLLAFLIIDPTALMDLVMEKFRTCLIKLKTQSNLGFDEVQYLISLGKCVYDYIEIYKIHEPTILSNYEKVFGYMEDLHKVLKECATVCWKFLVPCNDQQHALDNKCEKGDKQNNNRIMKRLKLLYSMLLNISQQIINETKYFEDDDNPSSNENSTQNVQQINETYTHKGVIGLLDNFKVAQHIENVNDSKVLSTVNNKTFSRSTIVRLRTSRNNSVFTKNISLASSNFYKKHESPCLCNSASFFSSNCDHQDFLLANISEEDMKLSKKILTESIVVSEQHKSNMERTNFRRNQRKSLRKTLLINKVKQNTNHSENNILNLGTTANHTQDLCKSNDNDYENISDGNTTDWHITEILEQLSRLSNTLSLMNIDIDKQLNNIQEKENKHIVKLKVNDQPFSSPKNQWNIKITNDHTSFEDCGVEKTTNKSVIKVDIDRSENNYSKSNFTINCGIDVSFESDVPTPERLRDINQLEEKLANLKQFWK